MLSYSKKYLFFIVCLFPFIALAQSWVVNGVVKDSVSGLPMENVIVSVSHPNSGIYTNGQGKFSVRVSKMEGAQLVFYHVGYSSKTISFQKFSPLKDTITLVVSLRMDAKISTLPASEVSARHKVDTVFGTWKFSIADYELLDGDRFIFLTFEKNIRRSKLILATSDQHILSSVEIPRDMDDAKYLYRDFQGNVNVICKEAIYRIKVNNELLILMM